MANPPLPEGYTISTDPELLDMTVIHRYLSQDSYWAQNIPLEVVERCVKHSFCFGIYYHGEQVGLARLVTDKASFAYLCDVFVLPAHRGKGLSKILMETVHHHPDLQGFRRWILATRDAHGLYEQFGWTALTAEQAPRFMQLHNPNAYKS